MEDQKQTPSNTPPTSPADQAAEAQAAQPATPNQTTEPAAAADDVATQLAAQLAEQEAKARENYDLYLRAVAEAENIRRRAQEDVAKAHKFAIESFAEHLLPVMDSLQAALADGSGDIAKLREGVELTAKQLASAFEKGRMVELNPVGEKFDPHRHQAISMVPSEQEPNTVVAVLQRGYLIADRVLRPALVTVAAPK
ncbi:nucleotide exchange factor GrpE [Cupriavidus cauae]|uniref:Protein GrpE n=1 Tax=Cupriavidus cauae TaxID=2608999 RepID=A0A5M8BDT7_9BURK|nr:MULTISPECIES: nucleotide exchange factor GrpE [Cupriavidus]KAA0179624.1 nucleotide exchange factor GrpE [Cupriavidus gilardii]KAA6133222.1 nucleotide exchange factor GrpE [Cupriavidus cauae]MCA7086222.1 nucleotide exchange factor GrpE [Cupriavidus sp. DB3]UZN47994.1 nucleotide exchange factor GrpE [Cupriavidus cauae]